MSEPQHAITPDDTDYRPVFNDKVRTGIYIACLLAAIVGSGFSKFGDPNVGDWITQIAGYIAAGFAVVYNPIRLGNKQP